MRAIQPLPTLCTVNPWLSTPRQTVCQVEKKATRARTASKVQTNAPNFEEQIDLVVRVCLPCVLSVPHLELEFVCFVMNVVPTDVTLFCARLHVNQSIHK